MQTKSDASTLTPTPDSPDTLPTRASETSPTPPLPVATAEAISAYMPLVERIASQLMRRLPRSVQRADLVAAGNLGLFHALRSTAHTSPTMFVAYASIRIRGAMVDELRRGDWSPRRRRAAIPTTDATRSNVTSMPPRALASVPPSPPSVAVVGFADLPVGAMAALAEQGLSPLEDVLARRARDELHAAVDELPEREREIIRMRYFQGMPSKAIAEAMGLSEARISQLHARATSQLKEILSRSGSSESVERIALAA